MTPGINFPIIAVMNSMPEVSKQNNPWCDCLKFINQRIDALNITINSFM